MHLIYLSTVCPWPEADLLKAEDLMAVVSFINQIFFGLTNHPDSDY